MKRKLPIISFIAAIVTMIIGILVIIGWFMHNDFLRSIVPGAVKMKFNVASAFILSSIVLFLHYFPGKNKIGHRISVLLSVLVFLIGVLTLIEYVFGINIGIDELFVKDELRTTAIYYAGRMSPLSAMNFLLIGIGLLLLNKEKAAAFQFYYLFGIAFVSLLMLIAFNFISDIPTYIRLAIHVAIGFITLSTAIWFAQPMLRKKISFERKLFMGFTAAIILIAVVGIFSSYYSNRRVSLSRWVRHENDIMSESEQISSLTKDIESGGRGYIITGDSAYLEYFVPAKDSLFNHVKKIKELTKDDPLQQVRIDSLEALIEKRIAISSLNISARNEKGFEAANKLMVAQRGRLYTNKIRRISSEIQQVEKDLLVQRQRQYNKSIIAFNQAFYIFLAGVFILLLVILFSIRNNISVRKKAEEKIKETENSFQLLVNSVKDYGIFLLDKNGCIASWNSGAERIKGYRAEEIIGRPMDVFYTDEEIQRGVPQLNLQMALQHGHYETEGLRLRKDGSAFYANIVFTALVNDEGKLYGYAKVTKDITEKRKAEEKIKEFQHFFNNSNDLSCIANKEGYFEILNPSFEKILGYSPKELSENPFIDFVHPDDISATLNEYGKLKSGATVIHFVNRYRKKDGDYLWFDWNATPNPVTGKLYCIARDITDRKKAEDALSKLNQELEQRVVERTAEVEKNERKYRGLIDNSYDMVSIINEKFKHLYRSPSAYRITGWTDEETEKIDRMELTHPDDIPALKAMMSKVLANPGKPFPISFRSRHKNGNYIWVDGVTTNMLHDESINGIVANFRDITQRKEAEEQIEKNEKRFRALVENSDDIIGLLNDKLVHLYRSPSSEKITGYSWEDRMKSRNMGEVHPDDNEKFENCLATIRANPGKAIPITYRLKHKKGHYIWLEGTFTNLLHDPAVGAIVANTRDITERKKAEETIADTLKEKNIILESIGDAFFAVDKNWTVTYWNRIAEKDLAVRKHEIIGKNLWEIFSDSIDSESYRRYHEAIETNQVVHFEDYYAVLNKWYEISAYPSENGLSVYFKDVTERKKAEEEIKTLNEDLEKKIIERTGQLRKSNEELEAFSYSVSHDLRAPLRGALAFATILDEEYGTKLDDEARRIIAVIKDNTLKMGNLIDDLLAFSRMGKQGVIKVPVNTQTMVKEIVADMAQQNNGHTKIRWNVQALSTVHADPKMIRQVWINLISNAVKYSGNKKQPCIEIGSYPEVDQTVFYIKDNGAGFNEEYKHKLLKVFQRLHDADEFEGTGVGLALVEKIISRHDGKVWAEGKEDEGACFYFSLPQ